MYFPPESYDDLAFVRFPNLHFEINSPTRQWTIPRTPYKEKIGNPKEIAIGRRWIVRKTQETWLGLPLPALERRSRAARFARSWFRLAGACYSACTPSFCRLAGCSLAFAATRLFGCGICGDRSRSGFRKHRKVFAQSLRDIGQCPRRVTQLAGDCVQERFFPSRLGCHLETSPGHKLPTPAKNEVPARSRDFK